ncbi:MAG TPA: hypothetical protein VF103_17145 [Polyangiaceae bacterium]
MLGELGRRIAAFLVGAAACVAACGRTGLLTADLQKDDEVLYDIELLNRDAFQKVDLLFVVDNSISMTDKQLLFADAVPTLLRRLISPQCLDENGNPTGAFSPCPAGTAEFRAIDDIHVGVVTSSLGDHGSDICRPDPEDATPRMLNDRAELLPAVRNGLYSYDATGFLVWDPRSPRPFPDPHPRVSEHEARLSDFIGDFASHVRAAGERGCGYEATLEAWYRFLVDPAPVAEMTTDGVSSVRGPVNPVVLEQRARFLRPDSLVAVVVLTDENDCSIVDEDGGQGWLVARRFPMPRATSQCAAPSTRSSSCCRPCGVEIEGCPRSASDSECLKGTVLTDVEDSTNLRCFRQRQRFGVDLLYPAKRYVDALTRPTLSRGPKVDGVVPNPLFAPGADGTPSREGRAFLVGIVGVPWQDIADPSSFDGRALRYMDIDEFSATLPNRWDVILGDPASGVEPGDPFMIESVDERRGANPVTGDRVQPSTPGGLSNPINGHEQAVQNLDDIQYACTFALPQPLPCTMENQDGCDCNVSEYPYSRSICQYQSPAFDGLQTGARRTPDFAKSRS